MVHRVTAADAWSARPHPTRLYRFLQVVVGAVIRALFTTRTVHMERLPRKGGIILVSNHTSNIDPALVVSCMPRPVFHLAKHTLFQSGFGEFFFLRLGGQIPVDREGGGNEAAVDAAVRCIEKGGAMAIYPEGGRSPDGRVCRGKTGVARLAVRTGAPVIPVAIEGTHAAWPKGKAFPKLFRRTRVIVGEARRYPHDPALAADAPRMQSITDELMGDVARLLGQDYDPATAPFLRRGVD